MPKLTRFYIKPSGEARYNESGIVYPKAIAIDFIKIAVETGCKNITWTDRFKWNKQENLLTFYASWGVVASLTCKLYGYPVNIVDVWAEFSSLTRDGLIEKMVRERKQPYFDMTNLVPDRIKDGNACKSLIRHPTVVNVEVISSKTDLWGDTLETEGYAG